MSPKKTFDIDTAAIHAGELTDSHGAHIGPIYQTSTFSFPNMQAVDEVVNGEKPGYVYGRSANPTRGALATKIATLEGHDLIQESQRDPAELVAAEVFSSGMAAISVALLGCAQAGQHIITQDVLYGSTDHLVNELLPQYGITSSIVKDLTADRLEAELAAHPNTSVVYVETPANPTMSLIDMAAVTEPCSCPRRTCNCRQHLCLANTPPTADAWGRRRCALNHEIHRGTWQYYRRCGCMPRHRAPNGSHWPADQIFRRGPKPIRLLVNKSRAENFAIAHASTLCERDGGSTFLRGASGNLGRPLSRAGELSAT